MNETNLKSVCLALGPYRNLTTLTASLLFLHPRCQVLNHGSDRILLNPDTNFLLDYSDRKFETFVRHAIGLSAQGRRGRFGGSIMLSHAFDDERIRNAYRDRFQENTVKADIDCLFWKESMRVSAFIRQHQVDLGGLFAVNSQLRFLMPIRNPVDCALSNMKTGHMRGLVDSEGPRAFGNTLDAVMREIRWFHELMNRYPDRFFCFYENGFNEGVVRSLAEFLQISADRTWVDDVIQNYDVRHPYEYTGEMKDVYRELVGRYFGALPGVRERLESFIQ